MTGTSMGHRHVFPKTPHGATRHPTGSRSRRAALPNTPRGALEGDLEKGRRDPLHLRRLRLLVKKLGADS